MPLITATEVIEELGLSNSAYSQIEKIIPGAINKAFRATNNYCHVPGQYVRSHYISFNAANKTITLNSGGFQTNDLNPIRFQAGMYIHVKGSILNNKVFLTSSVTNTLITLDSTETLFDEEEGSLVTIYMMDVDEGFKSAIIDYIGYKLKTSKSKGISSEKFDDYSVSFDDEAKVLSSFFSGYKKIVSSE